MRFKLLFSRIACSALLFALACCFQVGAVAQEEATTEQEQATEQQDPEKVAALMTAAQTGDLDAVKQLIESGVDVNSKTRYSATALSFAAEKGHLEIVKYLVEGGAEVMVKDSFYLSLIHI